VSAGGCAATGRAATGRAATARAATARVATASAVADPEVGLALAGGGCLLGDVDSATQQQRLIVPAGVISHTGLGGLALSGGVGWTCRHFGLTCDHIAASAVTCERLFSA
jgi:FAD/FMN-containing dehydrogenase